MTVDPDFHERYERALASLRGLSVGDALGSQFSIPANYGVLQSGGLPAGPWRWSDDTEMAASVMAGLVVHGRIDQDTLAASFAEHHDAARGYSANVDRMLRAIRQEGGDWRELAAGIFNGQGSWGNGAAMRVAPLGAWYAGDMEQAAHQAEISAYTTHQHREAVVGAMAVATAAALVADLPGPKAPAELLTEVLELMPRSAVQAGLRRARDMIDYADVGTVAAVLGCGRRTSAPDTVPFALWAVARHLDDYEGALRSTARAGGDVDTTCAIVGGIVAARPSGAPPLEWERRTEPLPDWLQGHFRHKGGTGAAEADAGVR
ncbi:MAG: ADP-ribosylglycohydrolase family protein [Streptomycetaceae bacterium]|nr:ADP-ribosylglycohydrolase family protein [Streptomycetaceae bacterium]